MEIFIVDVDNKNIKIDFYDNIFNFEQFKRDLDELYSDTWFDNVDDAKDYLEEFSND